MFVMYLGTQDGVIKLQYHNGRWHTLGTGLAGQDTWVIAHRPGTADVAYAGTYGRGLYWTTDGGQNWQPLIGGGSMDYVRAIAFAPDDPNTIYAGVEPANIFCSRDGGKTWTDLGVRNLPGAEAWFLPYSPREGAVRTLGVHPAQPTWIYAGIEQGGVLTSRDGGVTWTITHDGIHPDVHRLSIHPDDPRILFAATGGGVYRTRDGAETWERVIDGYTRAVAVHPMAPEFVFAGPSRRVGHEGRILASEDGGDTWVLAARGLEIPMLSMVESFAIHPDFPNDVFAILSDGRLIRSRTDRIRWRPLGLRVASVRDLDIADVKRKT